MDHREQVQQIIVKLTARAKRDGVITGEEQQLLSRIEDFVSRYETYLDQAEEDDIITDEEAARLKEMRIQMLEGAWMEADQDATITEDEAVLLNLLLKLLKGIEYTT